MVAVPYRIVMEDIQLTYLEQTLLDYLSRHFETVEDWTIADQILTTGDFISFAATFCPGAEDISTDRFLQLMDVISFDQCLNENNRKYYWLLQDKK